MSSVEVQAAHAGSLFKVVDGEGFATARVLRGVNFNSRGTFRIAAEVSAK